MKISTDLKLVQARLQSAKRVSALTGAGISAESGIPTFRDKGGIWEKFDPSKLATPEAFAKDPKHVWEWYALRMQAIREAKPNAAHHALVHLEKRFSTPNSFQLITQNIDNLHRTAGSQNLIELHGNIWRTRCLGCKVIRSLSAVPDVLPPYCLDCGNLLRPDVVWFGEALDPQAIVDAEAACETDIFLVIGTSGEVWPAAGLAHQAKRAGAFVVEVNTQRTALSEIVDISLLGKAGEILEKIMGIKEEDLFSH